MKKLFLLLSLFIFSACAANQTISKETASATNPEAKEKIEFLRMKGFELFYSKDPSVKDPKKAFEYFLEAANLGDPVSMDQVGGYYSSGTAGIEKSCAKAIEWFDKSASLGYPYALNNLAYLLVTCEDKKLRDPKRAEEIVKFLMTQNSIYIALLDTYAATLAATGDFKQAEKTMDVVIDLSNLIQSNAERIDEFKKTKTLYKNKKTLDSGIEADPQHFKKSK
ncbi:MAG: hypothetical protein M9962_05415 [Oligoflexia bacterium]|nr:hypothetical protein [Oligoflexia bacterium]